MTFTQKSLFLAKELPAALWNFIRYISSQIVVRGKVWSAISTINCPFFSSSLLRNDLDHTCFLILYLALLQPSLSCIFQIYIFSECTWWSDWWRNSLPGNQKNYLDFFNTCILLNPASSNFSPHHPPDIKVRIISLTNQCPVCWWSSFWLSSI